VVTVLYTAAHGGFAGEQVPLGGAGTVCNQLVDEWGRTKPFELRLLNPSILGAGAPTGRDLVRFTTRQYTDFCFDFERATTEEILRCDPDNTVVLANDVAEGPDFRRLAERGFAFYPIYHIDIVAYVAAMHLRSVFAPETLVRWFDRIERVWVPAVSKLVFQKQRDSVMHSRGMIVPSAGMLDVLLRCYPGVAREKIHVIPWGVVPINEPVVPNLREEFGVPKDALCFLTLSRIAPEKGLDLLLEALVGWEKPLWLFICGEASYMYGERFLRRLKKLASRLRNVKVIFPGHVTGARKQAFFQMADVYVFPSRTESYGLTLLEAMYAGLPAVCLDHHGARAVMKPEFGEIVPASGLRAALERMGGDPARRVRQGAAAKAFAETQLFSNSAARIAQLLAATVRSKTSS
jgi:glycosyltransferase involved in cell wall biosynthesis